MERGRLLSEGQRESIPDEASNRMRFFGTVTAMQSRIRYGYAVDLDIFPLDEKELGKWVTKVQLTEHKRDMRGAVDSNESGDSLDSDEEEEGLPPPLPESTTTATEHKVFVGVARNKIHVLREGQEEAQYTGGHVDEAMLDEIKAKDASQTKSAKLFCAQSDKDLSKATECEVRYGKDEDAFVKYKIHRENEHVMEDPLDPHNQGDAAFNPALDADIDLDAPLYKTFFDHIFPSVEGHAKIMDKIITNPNFARYGTSCPRGKPVMTFHDPTAEDPDWKVKQGCLLLIAASSEVETGIQNLWRHGKSPAGRRPCADFGQFMPENTFNVFCAAACYCWCEEKQWFKPFLDREWEIFEDMLDAFNGQRRELMRAVLLLLDESVSGWRPKTSKYGGLPSYTFEPRKPVPLGTMFRNGAESITGLLLFQDIVQDPSLQSQKEYEGVPAHCPGVKDGRVPAHTAEVLRQVKGARGPKSRVVEHEGKRRRKEDKLRHVGGDAWFGSIVTAVETKRSFDVESTWILKGNTHLFPKNQLAAVLAARHGKRIEGKWVVMTAVIAEVPIIAMAHAWSQKAVSFFVSTCGRTCPATKSCRSHFEDDWGNVSSKELPRPQLADFLHRCLPTIDEHNKKRQSHLALEKSWPTTLCWFRLQVTSACASST